jgi:hypothetical protein
MGSSRIGQGIGKRKGRRVMMLRLLLVRIHLRECGRSSVLYEPRTRR